MNRFRSTAINVVVITDRENREPMRSFLRQLDRLGYQSQIVTRITYDQTRRTAPPQVVMVDVAYRQFQGVTNVTTGIRATWEYVPMIILAHIDELSHIPFNSEFHGFLSLPITAQELDARIRFAQWKTQGALPSRDVLEVDELCMDLATYEVTVADQLVEMTFKEFELLKFFITHPRRVFSRPELLETVWESDYYGGTRTVDVHVRRLRAKLGPHIGSMIHTVRNVGYRFG